MYMIQYQSGTSCKAWCERDKVLCDHDYATSYQSRGEAQDEIERIKSEFADPDNLEIIETEGH